MTTTMRALALRGLLLGAAAMAAPGAVATTEGTPGLADFPPPLDPESWVLPEWMTWEDYVPIPGVDWNDPALQPPKKLRAAMILGDFADRDFIVTLPEGGDYVGINREFNPIGVGSIPREEVADFYTRFLITEPNALNNFHTVNEYWLEDSYGLIGVDATGFGPYRMSGKEHEYGLGGGDAGGGAGACPAGDTCGQDFDSELIEASLVDVTAGIALNGEDYDFRFLLHAGYDESGVWQELGEMIFPSRNDVTDVLGNPDDSKPNWAPTRYVEWSSFTASEAIWSHALPGVTSTQGESDGQSTYAHELSHIFGVLDNYNNPFSDPPRRSYTGLWAMLSRGTFNGPGGTHQRWRIPGTLGGSMGSHHMLRNKMRLGFIKPNEVLVAPRELLAATGPVVATIYPRAYPLAPITSDIGLHGIHVLMGEDRSPDCSTAEQFDCDGGGYTSYTVEVIDRIGFDSFTPDHGVLIAKNKDAVDLAPFMWAIDAHPEDINARVPPPPNDHRLIFDFIRPVQVPETLSWPTEGEAEPIVPGDARQLADALFHAGTGPGVVSEYVDAPNGLHFYVLDMAVDERGVRTYEVGVRAAGSDARPAADAGIVLDAVPAEVLAAPGRVAELRYTLRNPGSRRDFYRLSLSHPQGWPTHLRHTVVALEPGESRELRGYVRVPAAAEPLAASQLTLQARSETAPAQHSEAAAPLRVAQLVTAAPRDLAAATRGGALAPWLLLLIAGLFGGRRRQA